MLEPTMIKNRVSIRVQTAATVGAIAGAVVLPQIFHLIGAASGLGTGVTVGAWPVGRATERTVTCAGYRRQNVDLGTLRKFPGALRKARRQFLPAAAGERGSCFYPI